jgi:2-oxoglutarate ferredoxin oxidoreductase subunit alpha
VELSWRIAGRTGEGIDSAGEVLARAICRAGYPVHTFRTFPPIIQGGPTSYEVRAADRPVRARADTTRLLVALDGDALQRWAGEVAADGLVVVDADQPPEGGCSGPATLALPLTSLAQEAGHRIARNMVAVGASAGLLGLDLGHVEAEAARAFAGKGAAAVAQNQRALRLGYGAVRPRWRLPERDPGPVLLLSGNDALGAGAVAAGCRLYASYPITPATELLEWMARHLPAFGGAVLQAEDEIAALCMVIGANYAGVRAMTATSGPGFSLMTEAFGLAGMTETPAVVVAEQRPGPSAGMPTGHEQSDVNHAVFAGHGEFPRVVLTPGTVEECFADAALAFHLADRYQTLVIVLLDQQLALGKVTVPGLDPATLPYDRGSILGGAPGGGGGPFRRYEATASGVSPRALPGTPGRAFLASGDEHDEDGRIDVTQPGVRARMMDKRLRKLADVDAVAPGIAASGPPGAELVVVSFGSSGGAVDEAVRRLSRPVRHVRLRRLWPFPAEALREEVGAAREVAVVEQNATGQVARLLQAEVGCHGRVRSVRKYDGWPFKPAEVEEALR